MCVFYLDPGQASTTSESVETEESDSRDSVEHEVESVTGAVATDL